MIECFQPVARIDPNAKGREAVNTRCTAEGDECALRSDRDYALTCVENTCQIACKANPSCPEAWQCARKAGRDSGPLYCQLATCPSDEATRNAQSGPQG
jgi:hypothetical protein